MRNLIILLILTIGQLRSAAQNRTYKLEGNQLITASPVIFKTGSDELDEASQPALEEVRAYLTDKKYITLMRIEAHVAAGNNEQLNQELTKRRAKAVAAWLIKNGVDPNRLIAVYFGSTKPVAENSTPEGKAQNNRICFINAALMNRPIGGMPVDGGGMVACQPCL